MVNNSPVSFLAGLLDFSLNLFGSEKWDLKKKKNPSCANLAFGPRQLYNPESLVVAITQNYSYKTELNGKMISTLLRGNSCNILLLVDDISFSLFLLLHLSLCLFSIATLFYISLPHTQYAYLFFFSVFVYRLPQNNKLKKNIQQFTAFTFVFIYPDQYFPYVHINQQFSFVMNYRC